MKVKGTHQGGPNRPPFLFMATNAQFEANRLNALNSTGPRSVEGKSVSRFNSLKSGLFSKSRLLPGEDPAELEALVQSFRRTWQPVGQHEVELVDAMIQASWTQRRLDRLENELLNQLMADETLPQDCLLGAAFSKDCDNGKKLQAVFRQKQAAERSWHKAFNAFLRIQELRLREMQEAARQMLAAKGHEVPQAQPPAPNRVRSENSLQPLDTPRKIMTSSGPPAPLQQLSSR
jgi:hypothetical protein